MFLTPKELLEIIEKMYRKDTMQIIEFAVDEVLKKFKKEMPNENRLREIFSLILKMRKCNLEIENESKKCNELERKAEMIVKDIYKEKSITHNLTWKIVLNLFRLYQNEWYTQCNFLGYCQTILVEYLFKKYEDNVSFKEKIYNLFIKAFEKKTGEKYIKKM